VVVVKVNRQKSRLKARVACLPLEKIGVYIVSQRSSGFAMYVK